MSLTNVLLVVIAVQLTLTISEIEKVVRALRVLDEMLKELRLCSEWIMYIGKK